MPFKLDRLSGLPFPAQVNRQALAQLVAGRLHPGDRLPSVRQLARDLAVCRTTAERIHETLCAAMLAEMRPRSGTFVAAPPAQDITRGGDWARDVYALLKLVLERGRALQLDLGQLGRFIAELNQERAVHAGESPITFPLVATRDWYECVTHGLSAMVCAQFVHVSPTSEHVDLPERTRYLLAGYYMHERAVQLAQRMGCSLLFVRYNVALFDRAMKIRSGEHRYFVTRDADNADSTREFLASAYPEAALDRYSVETADEWLQRPEARSTDGEVWATVTAAPLVCAALPRSRLQLLHPLLAQDFIDELRCLALLTRS